MKKILFIMIAMAAVLSSCNDYETYGDKKEKERNAIAKFISDRSIVVISEDQFNQQGFTTDTVKNQYVKLDKVVCTCRLCAQAVAPSCRMARALVW